MEGRQVVVEHVKLLCNIFPRRRQLRFLIHCASPIGPTKSTFSIHPDELRVAMSKHCETPIFLSLALYPYLEPDDEVGIAGRVLHVSSGHENNGCGISVGSIASAAFFQAYQAMDREFRVAKGGKVIVGSFKTGVANLPRQRGNGLEDAMLMVDVVNSINEKADVDGDPASLVPGRPTLAGVFDTPENAANFAEYLLLGTTDNEFSNNGIANEYGINKTNAASAGFAQLPDASLTCRGKYSPSLQEPNASSGRPLQGYHMAFSLPPTLLKPTLKSSQKKVIH
jgi:hypothetical protein